MAEIAAAGFYEDPVMSWVFPDRSLRLEQLQLAFASLARRNLSRSGVIDMADDASVAIWLAPDPPPAPESTEPPPRRAIELFTPDVVERFAVLGAAMEANHPTDPHWYLHVLATVPERQGHGLGAQAIAAVLDRCDHHQRASYLESSNARNLPFYRRHGWVQTGEIVIPDGPTLFPMWREPRSPADAAR